MATKQKLLTENHKTKEKGEPHSLKKERKEKGDPLNTVIEEFYLCRLVQQKNLC